MLSPYGRREWRAIAAIGLMLLVTCLVIGWWWPAFAIVLLTTGVLTFFRDPHRRVPTQRGVFVSPADGKVTSIHRVEQFEPFGEAALCIRVFLSVLNVHINRSPCHAVIALTRHQDGHHLSALNPTSAEVNEWNLIVMRHPTGGHHVAAVRQVAGQLARTIRCGVKIDQTVQRGQRIGMITLGSTTELYIPESRGAKAAVVQGQRVRGGTTVLARFEATAPAENERSIDSKRDSAAELTESIAAP